MATMLSALLKAVSLMLSVILSFLSSFGIWSEQYKSLQSVTKIADNLYTMDYTYDYDVDTLIETGFGNSTTPELLLYAAADTITGADFSEVSNIVNAVHKYIDMEKVNNLASKVPYDKIAGTLAGIIESFGCTTFNSKTASGDKIFARNYDYMDSPLMTVWTHPSNGYASVSNVSLYFLGYADSYMPEDLLTSLETIIAPYIPVDGMNEKGLSIGVLELETSPTWQFTEKPDITTTVMIRKVLDNAATVEEAIEIFNSYDMHDMLAGNCTYHYQIADSKGNTAIIEYANGETTVIRPDKTKTLAATNFWLTDGVDDPKGLGKDRYDLVMKQLKAKNYTVSQKQAMDILKSVHLEDDDMNGYICSTLWSVVYNETALTFDIAVMYDYDNIYHFSLANPLKYTVN